ncbi:MAG: FHA domain-containing protein [Polyangiales bacterium]
MIVLLQTRGADINRRLEFDQNVVRIGRMPDSDIAFDVDRDLAASGRHAEIRQEVGRYLLIDASSRNGTWLNGERIKHAQLKEGDEIEFGMGGPRILVQTAVPKTSDSQPIRAVSQKIVRGGARRGHDDVPMTIQSKRPTTDTLSNNLPNDLPATPAAPPPIDLRDVLTKKKQIRRRQARKRFGLAVAVVGAFVFVSAVGWLSYRLMRADSVIVSLDDMRKAVPGAIGYVEKQTPSQAGRIVCMGFSIAPNMVATTASCASEVLGGGTFGATYQLVQAGRPRSQIVKAWRHHGYTSNQASPDVALLEVAIPYERSLMLADLDDIQRISAGDQVLVWNHDVEPVWTELDGVTRLEAGDPTANGKLLVDAHSYSGAPVFNSKGYVVGIYAGNAGMLGKDVKGYIVRADYLLALLKGI